MPVRGVFFLVLIFSFSLVQWAAAQDFTIIAVRGSIKSKKTGKPLRPGDVIPITDQITFKDKKDFVSFLTPEGARKYVNYPLRRFRKKKAVYDVEMIMKDGAAAYIPVTPWLANIEEAKLYFSGNGFLLFGPDSKMKMDRKIFPMSKALFFYVNYDFKDDNVDKKIDYRSDSIVFTKKNIFKIDGKEVDGKYAENFRLYYYNQPKNKHYPLGKWKPYFIVDERLKEETDVLIAQLKNKKATDESIVMEVAGFLTTQYGNMIAEDYRQWMQENYPSIVFPGIPLAPEPVVIVDEKAVAKKKEADEKARAKGKDASKVKPPKRAKAPKRRK